MARDQAKRRIVVVGAGIIGASFAFHLARGGVDVQVIDAGLRAGSVATENSWAWINASWGNAEAYFRLRQRSMGLWRELAGVVPDLGVNWCGGLLWDLPQDELENFAKQQSAWGYGTRLMGRDEALRIEPHLAAPPEMAVHVAEEGMVEPVQATLALVRAAEAWGARFHWGTAVSHIIVERGCARGIQSSKGAIHADEVVLAAGLGTGPLLEALNINIALDGPAGLLVHSQPVAPMLRGLVMSPHLHVRQTAGGRLVAGSDFAGAQPGDDPTLAARKLFGEMQEFLKDGRAIQFERYSIGYRPTPRDGVSAIGRLPDIDGIYLCVSHSGITLAPVLGHLGATEIIFGQRDELLLPFAPDRLLEKT